MTDSKEWEELQRIWGDGGLRVFISHSAERKRFAKDVQGDLRAYGMASFVAHEDIKPLKQWRGEIEKALWTCCWLCDLPPGLGPRDPRIQRAWSCRRGGRTPGAFGYPKRCGDGRHCSRPATSPQCDELRASS